MIHSLDLQPLYVTSLLLQRAKENAHTFVWAFFAAHVLLLLSHGALVRGEVRETLML